MFYCCTGLQKGINPCHMNDELNEFSSAPAPAYEDTITHHSPRLSANKLAEYIVTSPARQRAILKDAKFPQPFITTPYERTRKSIPQAFTKQNLNITTLVRRAEEIEQDNERNKGSISDWRKNANINNAEALKHIANIAPELSWENATSFPIRLPSLKIAGVTISVRPEMIFSFDHNGIKKVGGIILNSTKGKGQSLARSNGEHCAGDYLSTLLFQALLQLKNRIPLNTKCYALDVFREAVYTAPAGYSRLNKNIEAACEMVASRWTTIERTATARPPASQNIQS